MSILALASLLIATPSKLPLIEFKGGDDRAFVSFIAERTGGSVLLLAESGRTWPAFKFEAQPNASEEMRLIRSRSGISRLNSDHAGITAPAWPWAFYFGSQRMEYQASFKETGDLEVKDGKISLTPEKPVALNEKGFAGHPLNVHWFLNGARLIGVLRDVNAETFDSMLASALGARVVKAKGQTSLTLEGGEYKRLGIGLCDEGLGEHQGGLIYQEDLNYIRAVLDAMSPASVEKAMKEWNKSLFDAVPLTEQIRSLGMAHVWRRFGLDGDPKKEPSRKAWEQIESQLDVSSMSVVFLGNGTMGVAFFTKDGKTIRVF